MAAPQIVFSSSVADARDRGLPIVALESSVISHGLPWPENLAAWVDAERAVRQVGAVPATTAILDGRLCVGITPEQIHRLAVPRDVHKAGPRDIPYLIAERRCGATTVAGTLFLAQLAHIPVVATGGLGGVHRDVQESSDVSADLAQLARSPALVVCSGAKAILDLPRTLELLESLGVLVVGYGTDEFPAFLARSSGLRLEHRVDTPAAAAALFRAAQSIQFPSAIVIANPPHDQVAFAPERLEGIVSQAVAAARSAGVRGKALTPFLLEQVRKIAGPEALKANRFILAANAQLAGEIACALLAPHDSIQNACVTGPIRTA